MGAAILDHGGNYICQLPRQEECELSIGILEGGESSSYVYNDNNNDHDDDDNGTMTQISRFASC